MEEMSLKNRVLIREVYNKYNDLDKKEILICGWIRNLRSSKSISFIE